MGALPGAGPALWTGEGGSPILTESMRSQVPGSSLFVDPTVSGAAGSSHLVSMPTRAVEKQGLQDRNGGWSLGVRYVVEDWVLMPRDRSCFLGVGFDARHGLWFLGKESEVQGLLLM
jgi:hypothetical protein